MQFEDFSRVPGIITAPGMPPVVFCAVAKGGSTSFFSWLYRTLAGSPWPGYANSPWVMDYTDARRWQAHVASPYRIRRLAELSLAERRQHLANGARSFVLVRDPVERIVSAMFSKFLCGMNDYNDYGIVDTLARLAPRAAARATARLGVPAAPPWPCFAAQDFVDMLLEAQRGGWRFIDEHFRPQSTVCRFDSISYDVVIPLENSTQLEHGLRAMAVALGRPYVPMPHNHTANAKHPLPDRIRERIEHLYAADAVLHYPPCGPPRQCTEWLVLPVPPPVSPSLPPPPPPPPPTTTTPPPLPPPPPPAPPLHLPELLAAILPFLVTACTLALLCARAVAVGAGSTASASARRSTRRS